MIDPAPVAWSAKHRRPLIAFFEYHDVFEDFYPHYGIDQMSFATRAIESGNDAFLQLIQREIGDVDWYVFSLRPRLDAAQHKVVGCTIRFCESSWLHRTLWKLFYAPKFAWRWRRAYPVYAVAASYVSLLSLSFMRKLRQRRPEFLFAQDYATGRFDVLLLLARAMGIRLVAYHAGSVPETYIGSALKRWTIRCADRIIVSSHRELEMLAGRYRVPRNRMSVVLTPIDTEVFRPVDRTLACREERLDPSRRYLLFVGRFDDRVKRISSIIRAFSCLMNEHPDVRLLIAGGGQDEAELKQLVQEYAPGNIHFLGWVSDNTRKARLYSVAECLLLASRSEGFPSVVGEALACGTPVLASDVGGISELVVEGKTGWLFEAENDAELLRSLSHILKEPQLLPPMRGMARKVAEERVSLRTVVSQLRECFPQERKQ